MKNTHRVWLEDSVEELGGFWWYCYLDHNGCLQDEKYHANNSVKILDNTSSFYVGICLQPIELTKEWLLNFGFEKKYDDLNWYIKGNYCFSFLKELDLIVFKIKFQTVGICTIKYVHEAQNIYFALTGEELSL